ncbi:hypothetical protein ACJO19_11075 [Vibrio parahaemolyticus]|uniref:hypothetical protein n=2 Tax=Vibrio parahaemolyticus TaxID=670 RepID=UPI00387B22C7
MKIKHEEYKFLSKLVSKNNQSLLITIRNNKSYCKTDLATYVLDTDFNLPDDQYEMPFYSFGKYFSLTKSKELEAVYENDTVAVNNSDVSFSFHMPRVSFPAEYEVLSEQETMFKLDSKVRKSLNYVKKLKKLKASSLVFDSNDDFEVKVLFSNEAEKRDSKKGGMSEMSSKLDKVSKSFSGCINYELFNRLPALNFNVEVLDSKKMNFFTDKYAIYTH